MDLGTVKLRPLVLRGMLVEPGTVMFGLLVTSGNPLELRLVILETGVIMGRPLEPEDVTFG